MGEKNGITKNKALIAVAKKLLRVMFATEKARVKRVALGKIDDYQWGNHQVGPKGFCSHKRPRCQEE
jgi:hypothetical protein